MVEEKKTAVVMYGNPSYPELYLTDDKSAIEELQDGIIRVFYSDTRLKDGDIFQLNMGLEFAVDRLKEIIREETGREVSHLKMDRYTRIAPYPLKLDELLPYLKEIGKEMDIK